MALIVGRTWLELLSLRCHARSAIISRCYSSTSTLLQEPEDAITSASDTVTEKQKRTKRQTSAEDLVLDAGDGRIRGSAKRKKSTTPPVIEDLLVLRPKRYGELTPPRKTTHQERLDWYAKRFGRSVKSVAGAFSKAQLVSLVELVEPPMANVKKTDKNTLAKVLIESRRGWDWQDPDSLYRRYQEDLDRKAAREKELIPSRSGVPFISREIKMLAREVYLCASAVQSLTAYGDLSYKIGGPNRDDLNQVTIELEGSEEQVEKATELLAQQQESIQRQNYSFPAGSTVESSVITNIALFAKTYIEPTPDSSDLVLWAHKKGNKYSKFHLDRAAVERSTSLLRQMYHNVNKVASLEGYAYLPFNAGEALPLLTSTGINGLLTRFSAVRELTPWDVETIDQGARSMSVMDGTTGGSKNEFMPDLHRNFRSMSEESEVFVSMRFGHLVFPASSDLWDPTFFGSSIDLALPTRAPSQPYFLSSCPPRFLSFLQSEAEATEEGEFIVPEQYQERMASYTVDTSNTRIVTYKPLSGNQQRIKMLVGSQKQKVKDELWSFRLDEGVEMALFLPDKTNDLTTSLYNSRSVDTSQIEGDPFAARTDAGDQAPQYITFEGTEYILVSDVHERRAHLRDTPTVFDAVTLQKEGTVQWDLVTRYDRLEQGKRSTCVELCGKPTSEQLANLYMLARSVI